MLRFNCHSTVGGMPEAAKLQAEYLNLIKQSYF